jgi:hypothetical protein
MIPKNSFLEITIDEDFMVNKKWDETKLTIKVKVSFK